MRFLLMCCLFIRCLLLPCLFMRSVFMHTCCRGDGPVVEGAAPVLLTLTPASPKQPGGDWQLVGGDRRGSYKWMPPPLNGTLSPYQVLRCAEGTEEHQREQGTDTITLALPCPDPWAVIAAWPTLDRLRLDQHSHKQLLYTYRTLQLHEPADSHKWTKLPSAPTLRLWSALLDK
jgi:hypothetical protein